MSDLLGNITDVEKLKALLAQSQEGDKARAIDEAGMAKALKNRVRGQDHVVDDVSRLIRLQWGKLERKRPICNLLFLGPTGTGKTELAKAMAEYLFENEKNMIRFDCSEFSGAEGKTRLIGTPTGYVGADSGGQLTRPMLNNPKRLVLFDEIEKAWSGIFDLFLSMMGDGRLTEQGSGRVADFTQAIIVLTSNAESEAIGKIQAQVSDPQEQTNAVKQHLRDSKVFRPEILGRFDRIFVFKPLEGIVNAEIAVIKMRSLAKEYGLELAYVGPELIVEAMTKGNKLKDFGVRELDRVINEMLGDAMDAARRAGLKKVKLHVDEIGDLGVEPA
ncbi:MAG: ATP-dependent Clp protease ATP-binding subunit [Phycisphaerales bacterium]|nr:ATP-dependent Clp protease ATP-binding subunit [Phycisphaerales bacterium]